MRFALALGSLMSPGLGQVIAGKRRAGYLWAVGGVLVLVICAVSVWGLLALVGVRIASAIDAARDPHARRPLALDIALVFIGPVLLVLPLRVYVVEAFRAPSSSMYPTLEIGDHVFIDKLARTPARGDVFVFHHPCDPEKDYIKRVVGLAGDHVEVRCNVLYLNGAAVPSKLVERAARELRGDEPDGQLTGG